MIKMIKKERESDEGLIRRFSRKIQQSGVLKGVRANRFHKKAKRKNVLRAEAMYKAKMHKEVARLKKMGSYSPESVRELRKRLKKENVL